MKKPVNSRNPRRRARELVVQGIYQWLLTNNSADEVAEQLSQLEGYRRADEVLLTSLLRGTMQRSADLRILLAPHLDRDINELSPVEHAVLLLAAYELQAHLEVPYRVVINEAIEITKSFGGTDGFRFVNGVLDKLAPELRSAEINTR